MKLVLVPILMLLLLTQTFSKWMWVIEFNVNKDFIAKNLCINRERPQLKCGGKCQLMKRLAEEDEAESRNQSATKTQMNEVLFEEVHPGFELVLFAVKRPSRYPHYIIPLYVTPYYSIFHPPASA